MDSKTQTNPKVDIVFALDQLGFLKVNKVKYGDHDLEFSVKKEELLMRKQIEEFKALQRSMFLRDFEIVKSYEKKNELESYIYQQK